VVVDFLALGGPFGGLGVVLGGLLCGLWSRSRRCSCARGARPPPRCGRGGFFPWFYSFLVLAVAFCLKIIIIITIIIIRVKHMLPTTVCGELSVSYR
jgi:hypothetical protein